MFDRAFWRKFIALDMGNYYRDPADSRDSNYDKYFVEGKMIALELQAYNSHNTERLDVDGMMEPLLELPLTHEEFGIY